MRIVNSRSAWAAQWVEGQPWKHTKTRPPNKQENEGMQGL